jgi:hypothetical protein
MLCPHCGNVTPHDQVLECSTPAVKFGQQGVPRLDEFNRGMDFRLLQCQTCRDVSLYSKPEGIDIDWDEAELLHPSQYDLHPCVPEPICKNYREARRVQKTSPNAFAVLLRRALEAVCDDRAVPPGPLARRLKHLSDRGEIPGKLAEISTALRELGNAGAHHTTQRVTVALTWTMDQFFRTLLEYVYVAPHRLAEFQKSLKQYDESEQSAPANPPSPSAQAGGSR